MAGGAVSGGPVIGVNATAAAEPNEVDVPLVHDRDLSLFWCHPPAGAGAEHAHKHLEIAILFEPAVCAVSWPGPGGRRNTERVAGPGIVIIAPRQPHLCTWENASELILVHLDSRWQRRLLPKGLPEAVMTPAALAHDGILWQLAGGLRGLCLKENASEIEILPMVAHCVAARAIELITALPGPALRCLSDVQLHKVQELVWAKLAYEIHADDMARCVGLSQQYFAVLFKNTTGKTPAQYLFECRMQKADELLRTGRHKIGAVARLVGIWDAGYFTSRFRTHFGVSPRALINQSRALSSIRPSFSSERP